MTSEDFSDDYLRQQVESLSIAMEEPSQQPQLKKRKLDSTLSVPLAVPHQWIWTKIHSMVGDINEEHEVPDFDELEMRILLAPPPPNPTDTASEPC